jgi:hypothetical protein
MNTKRSKKLGKVYLVGAGPGDPGLITVKGLMCLRKADVVVYDRLVDETILGEAHKNAEKIYVGKAANHHTLDQEAINRLLVEKAREGKKVVRLKGGDPFVLGRGGEEAEALAANKIPLEVVPGVSSAVAVPAYAGIPVTHRGGDPSGSGLFIYRRDGPQSVGSKRNEDCVGQVGRRHGHSRDLDGDRKLGERGGPISQVRPFFVNARRCDYARNHPSPTVRDRYTSQYHGEG